MPRHSRVAPVLAALALLGAPRLALADVGDDESNYIPDPSERREDFMIGLHLGAAIGGASGYPNAVDKIDVAEFEQSTGAGLGGGGALWIGLTPRDFFTFGLGFHSIEVAGEGVRSTGYAIGVHIETFPMFGLGGAYRDLGIFFEGGAGPRTIVNDEDDVLADGGFMSSMGFGAFWEALRLGSHFNIGPFAQYDYQFSASLQSHIALIGLRTTFYSGPG